MDKLWYLSQISVFDELPMEDLMELDKMAPMSTIKKNTIIQTPENYHEGMYFIKEGKLRLYKINAEGKQFTLGILGKGNIFGEIDSFSFGTKDVFIETIEETLLCSLSKNHFENFIEKHPRLALRFLKALSDRLRERDAMLEKLAFGDIRTRTLHLLLKLSEQFGIKDGEYYKIDLPLTHQELANMIGATRESVSVLLKELVKEEIIRTGRKSVHLKVDIAKEQLEMSGG
ncbi:Crp/Fnr family transcriptional regulator [Chengkuizengella axinellae]|uniref:Crp/Fnr family transcriptional regulator n=1 Tax=Chengkuizengella axinellae TaxID=3064388 RepID=A0ABT9J2D7_9BACL|nr:Crp/Fnr family transcriptional regulator [Chengkuizengella sp. 2205SS18-9]MDP5275750.1 Crp/Fnr family transcriptional regulator [Chengkuizengella sp. 2205SS18-9]